MFSFLLLFSCHSAQAFDKKETTGYIAGGVSGFTTAVVRGQAAQFLIAWSASKLPPATVPYCSLAATVLHLITLCDSVERLINLYTEHELVISQYNPMAQLASFLTSGFDSSHFLKDTESTAWNQAFEKGKHDFVIFQTLTNGLTSAWLLGNILRNQATSFAPATKEARQEINGDVEAVWEDPARAKEWDKYLGRNGAGDPQRLFKSDPVLWDFLGGVQGKVVLDAGCGNGYIARSLMQKAHADRVIAVDLSRDNIEIANHAAKQEGITGIEFHTESGNSLPSVKDDSVDHIVSNYVLMDCADLEANVKSMYRVLKPGGTAVIVTLHPCFPLKDRTTVGGDLAFVWKKSYFSPDTHVLPLLAEEFSTNFKVRHRSLTEYWQTFTGAGFTVKNMKEPHLTQEQEAVFPPSFVAAHRDPIAIVYLLEKPRIIVNLTPERRAPAAVAQAVPMPEEPIVRTTKGRSNPFEQAVCWYEEERNPEDIPALEWQVGRKGTSKMTPKAAREYVKCLGNGWHFPSLWQLHLLKTQKDILGEDFVADEFWTDTRFKSSQCGIWVVDFSGGPSLNRHEDYECFVRCVREPT